MTDVVPALAPEVARARLAEKEAIIERGLDTFVEVGQALADVRRDRLYRPDYRTFEEYIEQRWQMSRKRAYDVIGASQVAAVLSPMGDIPAPSSERVARELAPLRDEPEVMVAAWVETTRRNGDKPTAKQTRAVVQERGRPLETRPAPPPTPDEQARAEQAWQLCVDAALKHVARGREHLSGLDALLTRRQDRADAARTLRRAANALNSAADRMEDLP